MSELDINYELLESKGMYVSYHNDEEYHQAMKERGVENG